ncbi:MAG: ion transporter [Methanobrevibacter sp.]|uniref:ion channel n=1 Tax=Methanobrevibacter sp. TaxID=66852 RepID=UPI0025F073B0|nr:ion channel [Methanobrevibacter sp.]MBR0270823.1 ion transporter [Methanobrevibacter sp.]
MNRKFLNVAQVILSIIIVIDVILITSTVIFDVSADFYQKILIFDIITCIILLFDFFYGFFKSDDKRQYFRDNWIELIASIPFDMILSPFMFLRYLRLIRLFRILFLVSEYFTVIGKFLKDTHLDEILAVFILIIIGSTLSLYVIDPGMNNLFDNLWFVVVSLTTVGYGDITPVSLSGKIVSLILLIVGVFIFSAITGAMSTYFMDNLLKEGSFHIIELKEELSEVNQQLLKNEETIDELKQEIKELKQIIKEK